MFKILKYLFLVSILKKVKKNIIAAITSILLIVFSSMFMNDLIMVTSGIYGYLIILFKWILNGCFLVVLVYNLFKLFKVISKSLSLSTTKEKAPALEAKRERVLSKEHLETKRERIIQKYMKEGL